MTLSKLTSSLSFSKKNRVFVGRPTFWGMAYKGADGVKLMLDILKAEFDRCLAFCGYRTVSEIEPSSINIPNHWPLKLP